ncbi:hypothetical protein AAZX31_13G285800 [Glycine max]|uniref:Uncharacterized protein n=2 Tax=Glycine subgen. Soja TaxID=1462606 RepID=K7M2T4_SOYBN|nr:uncharacterized protein LOC106795662 [Glycine max]XP_028189571.1 uncharacterized protein LOC114375910 [Glycine soja]KAG4961044.1 hypothetical protein JHK87_037677 [Glycine soja]KAG4978446.1 hypothetical protein JHK86_037920 [Glycine max]KAH1104126.1 hypothetical protein GYH30_037849 [Glycine max]KAH1218717.1 hypothetical protein GmHk_13G039030 [Glycine max]KHN36584.1 hypothetical protein glysoja_001315 [Glycine soja]|eukprot:XP_014621809.1 uncharacterized protein LOC106795662 [Glycine max]
MRNVSKNRFLTCFRPVVDIDDMLEPKAAVVDDSASCRFACIPVADKHDAKNSTTKATLSDQDMLAQNWIVVPRPQKRTFSKIIKADLFLLNTRARNKNLDGQGCFGSKRDYSAYTESSSTGDEKKQAFVGTNIQKIKPPEWSSSISSSNSPESKNESPKDQVEKQKKFRCLGIYWVLVSLVVTVFWGKVNVTIWTSLLLCFFSIWNGICCWKKEVLKLRNAESKAHKNSRRDRNGRSGRNKGTFVMGIESFT